MLAGLSAEYIFRTPPALFAHASSTPQKPKDNAPAITAAHRFPIIYASLGSSYEIRDAFCKRLIFDPEVLEAVAVVNAVDHQGQPLYPRLPAGGLTGIKDDRADIVL